MNNIDRMVQEVKRFAVGPASDGPVPEDLVKMLMRIVDLEDQNELKAVAAINKRVEDIVRTVAGGMADRA